MTTSFRFGKRALMALSCVGFVAASTVVLGSCQQIAGIEDRVYDAPDAAGPSIPASEICDHYCDLAMANCVGENAIYSKRETCLGICALLDPGDDLEPAGNTVACRADQAGKAKATREPAEYCPAAGPGGSGVCGDNCESYCSLVAGACPDLEQDPDCQAKCKGLVDTGDFDVVENHEGDTLQCRLVHVSSATVDPLGHCDHAQLVPFDWCEADGDSEPDCGEYCDLLATTCTGDLTVYESKEQCVSVCEALPKGKSSDETDNSVGCRHYHTYNAFADPTAHCSHAGPGGDGHCGHDDMDAGTASNCESYCTLLEAACSIEFTANYGTQDACVADCSGEPEEFGAVADSHYSIKKGLEGGDNFNCRMLHVTRAFDQRTECVNAIGGGVCQ